ncbi:hypothetical protein FRC06_000591 [Ceratobasidium sp. 370]|nr:hypothetical protein FRC06_000591 [Ceratobasidium sp. 370]
MLIDQFSPDEKRIVRHQGTSVVIGRSGTGKTTALIYKLRANAQAAALLDNEPPIRQLFVTRSRVLTQHIARNYQGLLESSNIAHKTREELAEIRRKNENSRKRELVEFDNEVDLRDDLPDRFSLLRDSHFPLFISFDKLCSLLEVDIESLQEGGCTKRSMIDFTDFKYGYWPKIDHALTRNLDPGLVFSEILGVIKGYRETLSRDDYVSNLSHRKSPLLLHARDRVYAIFEAYSKRARIRNQIDAADRTRAILEAHGSNPLSEASKVEYIFVDEVQDQLILDIHLLQSLCSNPDGGYWCGDTAQTISVGSSFRMKDLKAFIYEDMLSYCKSDHRYKAPAPFTTFELSVNFRSHGGIVQYAASLVEVIYTLFPNSIDHMEPETARIAGPAPLLFISPSDDESTFVRYLLGSRVVIIRSSDGTPFGLEFDDLIIYNFFAESEAPASSWRAILALRGEARNGRIYYDKNTVVPSTSPTLCAELKQLYVAVTRARHRCWLWDSGEVINLTKAFWLNFELVEVANALEMVAGFAASSKDLQEWTQRGQEFFSSGLYALAKSCFERAGQNKEAAIADAYYHMSEAKKTQDRRDHLKAAKMMESCAQLADVEHSNNVLWYHAATCFEAAREIPSSSRSYRNGKFYDRAALVSFEHQNFDDALLTLLPYSDKLDVLTFEKIRDVARMHYLRTSNYNKLRKLFDNNQDACIEYARLSGFSAQLKDLLKESSRFEDLANVHLAEGSPAEATQYLLRSATHPSSIPRVEKIASDYLWLNLGLDSTPDLKIRQQALQLFEILSPFEGKLGSMAFDLNLFKASLGQATISPNLLGSTDLQQPDSKHRLVLGYHHALQSSAWAIGNLPDGTGVLEYLTGWRTYADNIHSIIELHSPSQLSRVRQLLGCSVPTKKPRTGTFVHVASSSLIYGCAKDQAHIRIDRKTSRGENLISGADVDRLIKYELSERLKNRLLALHSELLDSYWVNPPTVSRVEHSSESLGASSGATTVEDHTRVVSMAATLLHPIRTCTTERLSGNSNRTIRHAWIVRLFSLVNPPTGTINNAPTLPEPLTNQAPEQRIQGWINEYIWSLKSSRKYPELFLSTFVMVIVNIHPSHLALQTALDTLQRGAENLGDRFECEALHDDSEESKIETIMTGYDQKTCLFALSQTLQHEELILLARGESYCPAKQQFISRIIAFNNLFDLRQTLFGRSTSAEPIPDSRAEDNDLVPRGTAPVDPIPSHEEHAPPISRLVAPEDKPNKAAKHIQQWWRRHRERQYLMESSELSNEAQYYRRLSPLISKHLVGTSKREKLFRKVLRGPGVLLILSIEMLGEQLDDSLYTTRLELQASNIDAKVIEALQKRLKAIGGFHKIVDTLRRALSADSSPEALKASNLR